MYFFILLNKGEAAVEGTISKGNISPTVHHGLANVRNLNTSGILLRQGKNAIEFSPEPFENQKYGDAGNIAEARPPDPKW
ncbi:MAG: hypothetical protein V2A78_11700 [bacterium]